MDSGVAKKFSAKNITSGDIGHREVGNTKPVDLIDYGALGQRRLEVDRGSSNIGNEGLSRFKESPGTHL